MKLDLESASCEAFRKLGEGKQNVTAGPLMNSRINEEKLLPLTLMKKGLDVER